MIAPTPSSATAVVMMSVTTAMARGGWLGENGRRGYSGVVLLGGRRGFDALVPVTGMFCLKLIVL